MFDEEDREIGYALFIAIALAIFVSIFTMSIAAGTVIGQFGKKASAGGSAMTLPVAGTTTTTSTTASTTSARTAPRASTATTTTPAHARRVTAVRCVRQTSMTVWSTPVRTAGLATTA